MKRSKIFLGVTTCLLAVAGIAAAKRFGPSRTRFYITLGFSSRCISTPALVCMPTTIFPSFQCTVSFVTNGIGIPITHSRAVYTDNNCITLLKYQQEG
jgi:hypothetical protein